MGKAKKPKELSLEEANQLVEEHCGWAQSIARSVARAWNLDWQLDGLDGAAMEALIFCSRRFQPDRGVPFRGYARKRIHEASTAAARKSRGWRSSSRAKKQAREISLELVTVFSELRVGELPGSAPIKGDPARAAIRDLLVGASIIQARQGVQSGLPEEVTEFKRSIEVLAQLEPVHQQLLWEVYWEGTSMRGVATNWDTDELNVIREHKALLAHLQKAIESGSRNSVNPLKIRPGLKDFAAKMARQSDIGKFSEMVQGRTS